LHDSFPTEVWLARDRERPEERFVIKTLRSATGAAVHTLLAAERDALMQVRHRNVVRCFGIARDASGASHLVLEAIEGWTVEELSRRLHARGARPALDAMLALGVGFAAALEAVHTAADTDGTPLALCHGHVDPSNLMVTRTGRAVLIDFSRAWGHRSTHPLRPRRSRHAAPEERGGGRPSAEADVFSLASVLIELIGDAWWDGARVGDGELVADVLATLGSCLDTVPSARPTAGALSDRLAQLLGRSCERPGADEVAGRHAERLVRAARLDHELHTPDASGGPRPVVLHEPAPPREPDEPALPRHEPLAPLEPAAPLAPPEPLEPLEGEPTRVERPVRVPSPDGWRESPHASFAWTPQPSLRACSAPSREPCDRVDEPTQRDVAWFDEEPTGAPQRDARAPCGERAGSPALSDHERADRATRWPGWIELVLLATTVVTAACWLAA
jgi:serine/threonine protein kinase